MSYCKKDDWILCESHLPTRESLMIRVKEFKTTEIIDFNDKVYQKSTLFYQYARFYVLINKD